MAFRWRADNCPLIAVFGSSLPSSPKKINSKLDKTFWIRACLNIVTDVSFAVHNISLPTLPRNYQTEIEVNIVDKGYTLQTSVYRDFDGNRAAVKVFSQGSDSKYIYSYNTDEIFKISGNNFNICS